MCIYVFTTITKDTWGKFWCVIRACISDIFISTFVIFMARLKLHLSWTSIFFFSRIIFFILNKMFGFIQKFNQNTRSCLMIKETVLIQNIRIKCFLINSINLHNIKNKFNLNWSKNNNYSFFHIQKYNARIFLWIKKIKHRSLLSFV